MESNTSADGAAFEAVPFSLVHDLLRRVHDSSDLHETLDAITGGVTDLVGFGIAVVCLTRADGMLEVVSVAAEEGVRQKLLGETTPLWDLERDGEFGEEWGLFRYVAHEHFRPWEGAAEVAVARRLDVPDAWHPYDTLYAPLRGARGDVIGMLQVDRPPGEVKPAAGARELLDFFAIQAGMAIRQYLEQQRLNDEIRLAKVAQSMMMNAVEGSDVDDVLSASAETLRAGFDADRVAIRLTGDAGDLPAQSWISSLVVVPPAPDEVLARMRELAQRAWREQRVLTISLDQPSPDLLPGVDVRSLIDSIEGREVTTLVQAPLGAGGEFFGYIALMRDRGHVPWTDSETRAVNNIARNLGTAVLNARLLERERAYAEDLREVDAYKRNLFATISHEFKGPLTAITGHAEILQDRDSEDAIDVSIDSIARNSARLSEMVEDLMLLQQVEEPDHVLEREAVDLPAAVSDAVDVWRTNALRHDITFRLQMPEVPVLALGESIEIGRVVANLVSNAVKYSKPGGEIRLATGVAEDRVWFSCTDDGLGMSKEDQARLFEQFVRGTDPAVRRIPGTGLGLSIVKRIVDQHQGTLDVVSRSGVGSTFTVTLLRAGAH